MKDMQSHSALNEVHIMAKLADLSDTDYQNTLVLHALIEILIEKGVLTREQLLAKARQLDTQLDQCISPDGFDYHSPVVKTKHAPPL